MDVNPLVLLGRKVRHLRKAHKWSQEALAERADLHWTYISQIERGQRNLGLKNIVKIARALRVPPSKLLEGIH